MKQFKQLVLTALGPLGLTHEDLWHTTYGEIQDLITAYRYKDFLASQSRAQMAIWLMSAWVKKVPSVSDLVGYWVDGENLSKEEYLQRCIKKAKERKGAG